MFSRYIVLLFLQSCLLSYCILFLRISSLTHHFSPTALVHTRHENFGIPAHARRVGEVPMLEAQHVSEPKGARNELRLHQPHIIIGWYGCSVDDQLVLNAERFEPCNSLRQIKKERGGHTQCHCILQSMHAAGRKGLNKSSSTDVYKCADTPPTHHLCSAKQTQNRAAQNRHA